MTKTTRKRSASIEPSKKESVRSITKSITATVVIVMIQMTTMSPDDAPRNMAGGTIRTRRSATSATRAGVTRQVMEVETSRAMAAASRSTAVVKKGTARMEKIVLTITRRVDRASMGDSNQRAMGNRKLVATVDNNNPDTASSKGATENKSMDGSNNPDMDSSNNQDMDSKRVTDASRSTVVVEVTTKKNMKRMSTGSVAAVSKVETNMVVGIRTVWTFQLEW
jgi:hypothetical protein